MSTAKVHILNGDYSRYGTSVYYQLYGRKSNQGTDKDEDNTTEGFQIRYKPLIQVTNQRKKKGKTFLGRLHTDKRTVETYLDINCLPSEIITRIVDNLEDKDTIINCLYVSKKWYECSINILYKTIQLTSTYRVGQFVSTLLENPNYGALVQSIDLSQLKNGFMDQDEEEQGFNYEYELPEVAYASWRDWRLRNNSFYGSEMLSSINRTRTRSINDGVSMYSNTFSRVSSRTRSSSLSAMSLQSTTKNVKCSKHAVIARIRKFFHNSTVADLKSNADDNSKKYIIDLGMYSKFEKSSRKISKLPYTNKFLLKYAHLHDLPMGYVLHLLTLCTNLKHLNLSNVTISSDFEILTLNSNGNKVSFSMLDEDYSDESLGDRNLFKSFVKYFSDSDKPYHYYEDTAYDYSTPNNKQFKQSHNMFSNNHRKKKRYQLRPLTNEDMCEKIANQKYLRTIEISNVVWLIKKDMKSIIMSVFENTRSQYEIDTNVDLYKPIINFTGSGLQTSLTIAGQGDLSTMLALLILGELLETANDEQIINWFNLRAMSVCYNEPLFNWQEDTIDLAKAANINLSLPGKLEFPSNIQLKYLIIRESRSDIFRILIDNELTDKFGVVIEYGSSCCNTSLKYHTDLFLDRIKTLRNQELLQHTGENYHMLSIL